MNQYEKFKKMERKSYSDVTRYLKSRTHLTAREWVIARLCADFRNTSNRAEMTWIGENLPELAPFVERPYSRQEVSNAHSAFQKKVRRSGATFFYAYYAGLLDTEQMISVIHNVISDIRELVEVEGVEVPEEHSEEVQMLIAEVLKRINESLEEEEEYDEYEEYVT
ncbi:hypothetical protein J2755_001709 [Methanohalophilus levihalophilus]|uniref:DUF5806 family protein n=1 Tax=Methanohalophilus levihalophilus TaxID=1431282 RepID=UPI001AE932DE|nr:DUF5806 family protein [Methanohalophilus levihalophilus]MBP2030761.1 hypothetical protein [Methanohalophilus levihalophilus]